MKKDDSLQNVDSGSPIGQAGLRGPMAVLPWVLLVVAAVWLIAAARPPKNPGAFHLSQAGLMLVSGDGRVKPLDTVARAALMRISGRQSARLNGETVPATQWLLDVMVSSPRRDQYQIFEITHPDVLGLMGIQQTTQKMFSFEEIRPHAEALQEQMDLAMQVRQDPQRKLTSAQSALLNLATEAGVYMQLAQGQTPYAVPPMAADEDWQPLVVAHQEAARTGRLNDAGAKLTQVLQSYAANDPAAFNSNVAGYNAMLREYFPRQFFKAQVETLYNHYAPFYKGTVLYFTIFLLGCAALLVSGFGQTALAQAVRNSAVLLLLLTLVLHTVGIAVRIYLHERPPVTSLYSSAVFIGWAAVALGILVEFVLKRLSIGIIVAGLSGFVTLLIAHFLALSEGDTMKNVQAVLDTNFWLATHVPTVTIGYSATFLAGLLGTIFIVLGVFTTWLNKGIRRDFGKAVYGVLCFALVLSFVGTVLGGIWADQSWGRFWGWDPKENGAVLIVLLNALILHARWGGMIRERGMMVLAVAGNIVTAWSWFGTNMLGVGLHSYGFMDSAVIAMWLFVLSQLVIIGIGCLPLSIWASYAEPAAQPASATPAAAGKRRTASATAAVKPAQA